MKKTILSSILFFLLSYCSHATETRENSLTCKADTLPTSALLVHLEQINIASFIGKPVDSFLVSIPANFYNLKVYGGSNSQGSLFRASYLRIDFTASCYGPGVRIYVTEYTHLERYSPTFSWDVTLFRKEKIDRIEVWKDQNTCINGSCKH